MHAVGDRDVLPAEARRMPVDLVRKDALHDVGHTRDVARVDEELQARPEAVILRAGVVVAEHVGAPAEEGGRVRRAAELGREVPLVEAPRERGSRHSRSSSERSSLSFSLRSASRSPRATRSSRSRTSGASSTGLNGFVT